MRLMIMSPDQGFANSLAKHLHHAGFGTDIFIMFEDASYALTQGHYDAVIFDPRVYDGDYKTWWRDRKTIRGAAEDTFLLLITDTPEERIIALESGADDSVTREVTPREVIARIRAVLRRSRVQTNDYHKFSDVTLCPFTREVSVGGLALQLQKRETFILEALMRRRGRVVPRAGLEHDVYGALAEYCPNSLEVRVSRIRRQLAKAGSHVKIEVVRGVGYRLAAECG